MSQKGPSGSIDTQAPKASRKSYAFPPQTSKKDSLSDNASSAIERSNMSTTVEHNDDPVATTSSNTELILKKITMSSPLEAILFILRNTDKGRSSIEGNIYHLHLVIMIILRAYRMRQQDNEFDFLVAMEVAAAGKFDDILYHYSSPRLASGTFVIQAKHKENKGSKIEQDALCPPQEDSKSTYSIPMYFVSFLEVHQTFADNTRYVLCTNADLHVKLRESYFKEIEPQKDDSLLFCEAIGATCYQFDADKPFPGLYEKLQNACIAKLGKELAQTIDNKKVIAFNDTLFNTFVNLINSCIEQLPIEQETRDSCVNIYKFTENFFKADIATPTGKLRSCFAREHEMLLKKKKKKDNNNTMYELKLMIDMESFTAARNSAEIEQLTKFDQKVREFYRKFLLVCNSFNEEELKTQAETLLPQWCGADLKAIIDNLEGTLLNEMKSSAQPVPLDLKYMQEFFVNKELKQNISDLRHSSNQYFETLNNFHHIQLDPVYLEGSNLYSFLKNESGSETFEFNSTLDLTVSSRILSEALSLLKYETIFVDSTKYATNQEMNDILDDLLSYLRDVNHPTIKVVSILGKHDTVSIDKIKELSKKYRQKIVVVEKMSESSQNDKTFERILVKDLSEEASRKLYKQTERMMFGTNTPLSSIVEETDDLSFLIDVLEFCDQSREIKDHYSNKHIYEHIKHWYVCRQFVPYEQQRHYHLNFCKPEDVQNALASNDEEPDAPGLQNGDGGKVCIFLNDAGLGKTTYFTWLAWRLSTSDPTLFVIKFIAKEYSTDFDRLKGCGVENLSDIDIMRTLYRYIHLALFVPNINSRTIKETDKHRHKADLSANLLKISNGRIILDETKNNELSTKELIELRLFREKFNEQKFVLILDGFDEIAPHYKDVVMKCFARFARLDGVRSLFLSSRPYGFEQDLKKAFDQCRMYRLKPFSKDDILLSFHKFLSCNLEDYEHYAEKYRIDILQTLYEIILDVLEDIITVPLLLYMVQIILLPEIRKHVNEKKGKISKQILDDIKIDKLHLVELFVDKKVNILTTDKEGKTDSAGTSAAAKGNEERLKKEIKEQHMLLAMYVIFDETDIEKLLSKKEQKRAGKIMEEVQQGDEKTGIVLGEQYGVPQFLHRTFAEYFTACWLFKNWERFKNEKIFHSRTIWSHSLKETREFLDRLILKESEGCDLHLALVNESEEQIEKILRDNPSAVTVKDKVGRLPLHLVYYSENRIMKLLLEKMPPGLVSEKDNLYQWNALDYAFVRDERNLIQMLYARGVKPNMDTLVPQVCSNQIDVLLEKGSEYEDTFDHLLNRKELAEELSERVVKYLKEDKQIDIYSQLPKSNFLSVLKKVLTQRKLSSFRQLISKSDRQELALANQLLQLSLKKKGYFITSYLIQQHPSLVAMINVESLFKCAKNAIRKNQMEWFKTFFRESCIKQKIECVDDDKIIVDCDVQGKDEAFEIDIPFKDYCCEMFYWKGFSEFSLEKLLSAAIHYGNTQMTNYILQKTNMVVTFELIRNILKLIRRSEYKNNNHKKCMSAFKYLFKKTIDLYAVDEEGLNLFLIIVKHGCVYMLHSLMAIGFDSKRIDIINHWDVLRHPLFQWNEQYSANMFVYLQQRSYVDCFDILGPTGKSILEIAFTNERFIVAKALVEDKFRHLSDSEKETAVLDVLQQLLLKYGDELFLNAIKSLVTETSTEGKLANEAWHSVYSSIGDTAHEQIQKKFYLVEQFINRKFKTFNTNNTETIDSTEKTAQAMNYEDRWREQYMLLAMYVICDKTDREKLLSTEEQKRANEIMKEVKQGGEKTGFVLGVQNGVPQFRYRSFAEYFIACWLFKNLERFKSESIFQSQTIWSSSMKETREFFDRLILRESEGCDLHLALVNRSEEQIEEILRSDPSAVTVKDKVGRLPLHLVGYSKKRTMKPILEKMPPGLVNEKDNLYGWNALDYAFVLDERGLIETLVESGVEPNMDTLFQQVCSNQIDVLLEKESTYEHIFDHLLNRKELAEELSEREAKYLNEDKHIDMDSSPSELNSLSVLEKVVALDSFSIFRQLISKSDPLALFLGDRAKQLLKFSLVKERYNITCYLFKKYSPLVAMTEDISGLFYCAVKTIEYNQMKSFKTIFGKFCIEQKIECVAEDKIIDDCDDQGEDETFEIEIPFKANCCEVFDWSGPLKTSIEALLSAAIHYGNIQMVSYILQKTNMVVTLELIRNIMKELQGEGNHKKCISAFKYLFKKTPDLYAVDEEGLNLLFIIIKYGCVYMLHSLIAIGFDPRMISIINHWDVLQKHLLESNQKISANIFVYLQQRSYVDCFDTLGPTGESIFEIAITKKRFTEAQALIEDKFSHLSKSKKETAVMGILQQVLLKNGNELFLEAVVRLFWESLTACEVSNETWHSVYSPITNTAHEQILKKIHLIEQFIDRKFETLNTSNTGMIDSTAKNNENRWREQFMLLAMYVMFNKADREKLLSTEEQKRAEEIMEEVKQGDEKMGIVLGVQNGVPQFLHRTFAEYFTACWLFKNLERFKSESIFQSQTIWSSSMKETREFFDRLILRESEGWDLHLALVNRSEEQIEEILRYNPPAVTVKDKVGRLPLHLQDYSDKQTIKSLLKKMRPGLVYENDNLYGWNALDYAFVLGKRGLIETLVESGVEPNMDTLVTQVCSNQIDVLLEKGSRYGDIFDQRLKRKDLAEELSERVAKYLIEDKQIDMDSPLAELNSLSVLEEVVTLDTVSIFCQLISKSDSHALALDVRTNQLFQLSIEKRSYNITCYLIEQLPPLVIMINDKKVLYDIAECAITNNKMELLKTIFRKFCIEQKIEFVDKDNIIDDCDVQGKNEPFEIEIPFKSNCCEISNSNGFQECSVKELLSLAIYYGNIQMVSYMLQSDEYGRNARIAKKYDETVTNESVRK